MLEFVILAYTLGPLATIFYGLHILSMTPLEVFLLLSLLNILPLPLLFKLFELGGRHRSLYQMRILQKVSRVTGGDLTDLMNKGDRITELFKQRLGHLGFYLSIALFTFVFGILWASLLSYILMIKRKRAILCMSIGVVFGNTFWLLLAEYSRDLITPVGVIAISMAIPLLIYGSKREMAVIKEIAALLGLKKSDPGGFSPQR
ncbi:MAG: small multi-drug export protein [Candidatus Altiarchaeota archaeon]|nr:small multi-drug export protein [Candidatus Altiarchaeota archaeon]